MIIVNTTVKYRDLVLMKQKSIANIFKICLCFFVVSTEHKVTYDKLLTIQRCLIRDVMCV